ncbi:MAG: glycosyltransferase [Candidatus Paceibacterota bacterium]
MIPKIIHYCWFGDNPKNEEILDCIESWKKTCPDFEIKEWNELNFPLEQFPFASRMYNEKKWAFVVDYVRLDILYREGGFYLDTDMLLLQSLSPLTEHTCALGEESVGVISAGMIGAEAKNPFIAACKKFYDEDPKGLVTIPRVLSTVYETYTDKESLTVYPPKTFYPFNSEHIKEFHGQKLGPDVVGVHLWHYSWGSPLNKFFKKIGIYSFGKRVTEILGIKPLLKKLFGFI